MLVLFLSFCQAFAAETIFDIFARQVALTVALTPQMHLIGVQVATISALPKDFVSTRARLFTSGRFALSCEPALFRVS